MAGWDVVPNGDTSAWKPVREASAPVSTQPEDTRNDAQRTFDSATKSVPIDLTHGLGNALNSTLGNLGGGALSLAAPLFHPIATAHGLRDLVTPQSATEQGASFLGPGIVPMLHMASSAVNAVKPKQGETFGQNAARAGGEAISAIPAATAAAFGDEAAGLRDLIPTKAGAGRLFESVMNDAATQPVKLTRSMEPLERAQQISARGGNTVSAVDNLYKRINTINPLDYREARDWASNLSRLSGQDAMNASPALRAQIGKLSHAFNEDVGDAAAAVGRGEDYAKAMRDYARAAKL